MFSCFGAKKESSSAAPAPPSVSQVISERAKSMSQEMARSRSHKTEDDDEFQLRLQGFDENDPEFKAAKEEKIKRRSQDMESKRKSQEEDFQRRLQGL
jgi:hypothetical protein